MIAVIDTINAAAQGAMVKATTRRRGTAHSARGGNQHKLDSDKVNELNSCMHSVCFIIISFIRFSTRDRATMVNDPKSTLSHCLLFSTHHENKN
jgi:hypothetical protein